MEPKMTDDMLDDVAAEALGMVPAGTVAVSAEGRALDRDLRATVARLAAASPYMDPPEDLRGRILQATAPGSFRMEEYRKVTRDNSKFFKWGFYAAMLFMMAAAWYNITVENHNAAMRQNLALADKQVQEIKAALATFVSPGVQQITFEDNSKPWARAWVDDSTGHAVVVMPQELVASDNLGQLVLTRDGKEIRYQTTVLSAPASMLAVKTPVGLTIKAALNVKTLSPDSNPTRVFTAGVGKEK